MGSSRPEYSSGLPFAPPGDLPDPGIDPASLMFPALAGGFLPPAPLGKVIQIGERSCFWLATEEPEEGEISMG